MTRRIILHIGPAKTGTSSLQEALFAARADLQAQGFEYPAFGRHRFMPKLPGHHGIPATVRRLGELPPDLLPGLAATDPEKTVILSSEDFALMDETAVARFIELLGPARIELVYYARRWDSLLPSTWQELVKHGHSWPYLEFLNGQVSAPRASHYLNYAVPLDRWAKAVGIENLRIFSYDNVLAGGDDIVSHFASRVLGVPLEAGAVRRENPRWSTERVEILRVLNRLAFGRSQADASIRTRLVNAPAPVTEEVAALEKLLRPHVTEVRPCAPLVWQHIERPFLATYGRQVENLTEAGHLFTETLFDTAEYVHSNYLLETDALAQLRGLSARLQPAEKTQA